MSAKLTGPTARHRFARFFTRIGRDQTGATAIEYGLVLVLISVASLAAFQTLSDSISSMYGSVASDFNAAMPDDGGGSSPASDASPTN